MSYVMNNIRITGYTEDIQYFMNDYLEIKDNKPHLDFSEYIDEEEGPVYWVSVEEPCNIRALEGVSTVSQYAESKSGLESAIEDLANKYPKLIFEIGTHWPSVGGSYHKYYMSRVIEYSESSYDLYLEELEHVLRKINLYVEPQEDLF